jgi:hypothetical protein
MSDGITDMMRDDIERLEDAEILKEAKLKAEIQEVFFEIIRENNILCKRLTDLEWFTEGVKFGNKYLNK